MKWWHFFLINALTITIHAQINSLEKGMVVGCFKRSHHEMRESLRYIKNCFDHCAAKFYRYSVLYDSTCSCENLLKESEVEKSKCDQKCPPYYPTNDTDVSCGGQDFESFYGTGSNLPGPIRNLMENSTTYDKILLTFDSPERNGTELTEFEAKAIVLHTYSTEPWANKTHTKKISKSMQKLEFSELTPATEYNITIISKSGNLNGGERSIISQTKLAAPFPPPAAPKILNQSNGYVTIEIKKAINNNGPVSAYWVVVHFVENELIHDFDPSLLDSYQKAKDDGLGYYIAAELDPFDSDTMTFRVGDGTRYGRFFNAPLPSKHFHIYIGLVSIIHDDQNVTFSESSHEEEIIVFNSIEDDSTDVIIIFLTLACIICGLILVGAIVFYGYIKTRINPRRLNAFERHEMSLQGPILEVDNNGFISDVSGINFKEKLQEVLLSLDDDQKIIRKNLSLDIDNILGIGSFGDVIKGQLNTNIPCQVHVVSADDMDPPIQTKFIRDLNNLLNFGFHKNMLNFMGICQTHDWFFVVFEDTPATLKQFLLKNRNEMSLSSRRMTNLGENEIIRLMYELSETIEYLAYNKILHKNLSTHTVRIKRQNSAYTIKLSTFGPTLYHISEDGTKNMIDEERWHAPEVMRFQKYSHASDVYSFGLVLWEMSCLGATAYGSITTSELFNRVKKGMRPDKYLFISEDLYQLMLNCWELDPNERCEISDASGHLKQMQMQPQYYLNFNYDGQLPYYLPLLEIKN